MCVFLYKLSNQKIRKMKKSLLFFILLFMLSFAINAQNTFPSSGNVGIGTTSPSASLEIRNPTTNFSALKIAPLGNSHSYVYIERRNGKDGGIILTEDGISDYQIVNRDNRDFSIYSYTKSDYVFNIQNSTGNIGIATTNPAGYKLAVNGSIRAKEVKVETGWSDFVFYSDYSLPSLAEVEAHIKEKGHLKDIPSAKEVEENGIYLGDMNAKLLQKIEELMLYTIQQQKEIDGLKADLSILKSQK